MKRIHQNSTWYVFSAPCNFYMAPWNYISNFIHVDSTTVYKRMSTQKSTWILCCLSTWHPRGFYKLFLSGRCHLLIFIGFSEFMESIFF